MARGRAVRKSARGTAHDTAHLRAFPGRSRRFARCAGVGMVEVVVAIVILAVVVIGLMPFMATGRIGVERAAQKRVALQIAAERLERGRAGGYPALANASGSVVRDGLTYNWTLTVTTPLRADPADAASTYKHAEVSVTWTGAPAAVIVRTAVSP